MPVGSCPNPCAAVLAEELPSLFFSFQLLFFLFIVCSVPASDVVGSELQEDLSGNVAEFAYHSSIKLTHGNIHVTLKIVGSFIVNSVAHEKRK